MHFRITSDANSESGLGEIVDELSGPARQFFAQRDYGAGLLGVVVVLMCRDPKLNFERRLRFARKEKKLFMDIMLDLDEMRHALPARRRAIIAGRLLLDIPEVVRKYAIKTFDEASFIVELKGWLAGRGVDTSLAGAATH
jgi:hypothetical protein